MKKSEGKAVPFWKETPLVDEREIFTELASKKGSSLFLGRYSLSEILAVLNKKGILKPGGLIVLRHYFKIKPKLGDFKLERRVALGDDILSLFVREAGESGGEPGPGEPAETGLPAAPRSPKMGRPRRKDTETRP